MTADHPILATLRLSLFGFNVGVELAQMAVVALTGATLAVLRVLASFSQGMNIVFMTAKAVSIAAVTLAWLESRRARVNRS